MNLTVIKDFPLPRNSRIKRPDSGGSRDLHPIDAAGEKDLTLSTAGCAKLRKLPVTVGHCSAVQVSRTRPPGELMRTSTIDVADLRGVFAVPPLARRVDAVRAIDFEQNERIVRHVTSGGITRLIYGGNAFLYHITLAEYEQLLDWLAHLESWVIPSVGPDYGRAIDQATLLRNHRFPCAMVLPCSDPRDAFGLERGYREIAEAADTKLILYLKDEENFGKDKEAGLDSVARLVDDGVCIGIKYAVVRVDPSRDAYLEGLLRRVD